jgi:hypothetical protein
MTWSKQTIMKKIILGLLLMLFGCSDPADKASENLKKGDEFFGKNEYEVAEYYYEKIPEESPFFHQAQKKLNAIAVVKAKWKVAVGDTVEISKVVIIDNKYKADNLSKEPIHTITLVNKSWKKLESVNIEFIYYNEAGTVVTRLVGDVKTDLEPRTQSVFENISPGTVHERFVKCEAKIINAYFQ